MACILMLYRPTVWVWRSSQCYKWSVTVSGRRCQWSIREQSGLSLDDHRCQ